MKKLIVLIVLINVSCIGNKVTISANKASYNIWHGGQPGVSGTNFVFDIYNKSNLVLELDSVLINGKKYKNISLIKEKDLLVVKVHKVETSDYKRPKIDDKPIKKVKQEVYNNATIFLRDDNNKKYKIEFKKFHKVKTEFYR